MGILLKLGNFIRYFSIKSHIKISTEVSIVASRVLRRDKALTDKE